MPESDLALLIEAAREAGRIALDYWRQRPEVWEKPDGAGPVTEADIAVNDMLAQVLRGARPGYGWLSEESEDDPARLVAEQVFIIDPIDGTRAFIAGEEGFSHSLAVVEAGVVTAGVVYLPAQNKMYAARMGAPATLNGAAIRPSAHAMAEAAQVLTTGAAMKPEHWPGGMPELLRVFRPSLAWRMCLVAEGRFDAMLTLRDAWEWDIAAGDLIARQAGARVTDRHGQPLRYNTAHPQAAGVVAAPEALHADLMTRLGVSAV